MFKMIAILNFYSLERLLIGSTSFLFCLLDLIVWMTQYNEFLCFKRKENEGLFFHYNELKSPNKKRKIENE